MSNQTADALRIARKYTLWSSGAGLLPVPFLDVAAVTGIQVRMLYALARLYRVKIDRRQAKSAVASLAASVGAVSLFHGIPGEVVWRLPFLNLVGVLTKPVFAGLATYGVGNVFITHFEKGGTIQTLDPSDPEVHKAYQDGVKKGRKLEATA